MLYSLRSYARLRSIRRAFLLIELDAPFAAEQTRLVNVTRELFGSRLSLLRFKRNVGPSSSAPPLHASFLCLPLLRLSLLRLTLSLFSFCLPRVPLLHGHQGCVLTPSHLSRGAQTRQEEWREILPLIASSNEPSDGEHLVWLMQSDDHPFVDVDEEVWDAGLTALCAHSAFFKSIYPSHWPDALQLAQKFQDPLPFGRAFIGAKLTQTDAVQVSVW